MALEKQTNETNRQPVAAYMRPGKHRKSRQRRDQLERDKDVMPFIATIKKIKNYTAYE